MTTKIEKKMIGCFYKLTEENLKLEKQTEILKAAIIKEKTNGLFNGPWDSGLSKTFDEEINACKQEAIKRLTKEFPEVDWSI